MLHQPFHGTSPTLSRPSRAVGFRFFIDLKSFTRANLIILNKSAKPADIRKGNCGFCLLCAKALMNKTFLLSCKSYTHINYYCSKIII